MFDSVVEGGDVLANGYLEAGVVRTINLILLLSFGEDEEAGLAGEGSTGETTDNLLRDEFLGSAEKLHAQEVLVKLHEERSVVLLHVVAGTAPCQVRLDTYTQFKLVACSNTYR